MKSYEVIVPVSFEAVYYIDAESEEEAADIAVELYRYATPEERTSNIGAEYLLEADGNGAAIGKPIVYDATEY